jgi:hypothetical protein
MIGRHLTTQSRVKHPKSLIRIRDIIMMKATSDKRIIGKAILLERSKHVPQGLSSID